jgi:uncharacterized protein (TIGR03067 family)
MRRAESHRRLGGLAHGPLEEQAQSAAGMVHHDVSSAIRGGIRFAERISERKSFRGKTWFYHGEVAMLWCSLLILLAPVGAGDGARSEDIAQNELQQFQGSWTAVSIQHADGRQASKDEVQNTRLVIEGKKFTLVGKNYTISGVFTINSFKTPKTIDVVLTSKDGRAMKFLGIYEMQGDTRKSCFALPDNERPTQFSSAKGYFGFEWKRD